MSINSHFILPYSSGTLDSERERQEQTSFKLNTSARAFFLILNTNHPAFFWRLEQCSENNLKLAEISKSNRPKIVKLFHKIPPIISIIWHMLRLYLIKPIDAESIRETVR